ncbi:uncharacterized protein METZ01_LOCUS170268 [marine metagenome]|uniref:Uncharacterized protein n=1 Tax=marine metagenome TaxID=408172 RepID=A0A382BUX1_9ZZZZ
MKINHPPAQTSALTNIRYILPLSGINDDGVRYSVTLYKKGFIYVHSFVHRRRGTSSNMGRQGIHDSITKWYTRV